MRVVNCLNEISYYKLNIFKKNYLFILIILIKNAEFKICLEFDMLVIAVGAENEELSVSEKKSKIK